MAYRVNLTDRASRDFDDLYDFINASESVAAARRFSRLEDMIDSLATAPRMGKGAREDKDVREVIYGNKPHFYRVLYQIDESDRRIDILTIWHGKRNPPVY